ncbi:MAG: hypothetical protein VYA84_06965 [Planctomycetota bacterium]|nr:hypothetical protein [Planctomycetota bacterium]
MSSISKPNSNLTTARVHTKQHNRALLSHRLVQGGILLTLIWKWSFFVAANGIYGTIPLNDPFFPGWLQSVTAVRVAFVTAVAAVGLNLSTNRPRLQWACSLTALLCITVLCIHQASYNDMTFVTAWWASLWAMWFVNHLNDPNQAKLLRRASFLSRLIISLILLGGASGKWTAEYWSGEVFTDIYFKDREFWVFQWLRSHFEPEQLRTIATWYSRKVVLVETVTGLGLWALPPRIAAVLAILLLSSIALFSNFLLFSVLFALIGLASVGLLVPRS